MKHYFNKILKLSFAIALLAIAASVVYHFFFYLPQLHQAELELKEKIELHQLDEERNIEEIKIDKVKGEQTTLSEEQLELKNEIESFNLAFGENQKKLTLRTYIIYASIGALLIISIIAIAIAIKRTISKFLKVF